MACLLAWRAIRAWSSCHERTSSRGAHVASACMWCYMHAGRAQGWKWSDGCIRPPVTPAGLDTRTRRLGSTCMQMQVVSLSPTQLPMQCDQDGVDRGRRRRRQRELASVRRAIILPAARRASSRCTEPAGAAALGLAHQDRASTFFIWTRFVRHATNVVTAPNTRPRSSTNFTPTESSSTHTRMKSCSTMPKCILPNRRCYGTCPSFFF